MTQAHAPDLSEALVGFRHWRLENARLRSPFFDYEWERGVNTARCGAGAAHVQPAPAHACSCGLHAWYRPRPRLGCAACDLVGGAVALWGEVELHPTGMRAQHAVVVALVLPRGRRKKQRRIVDAADALGVVAVPAQELMEVALVHGKPLGRGMVPNLAY